MEKNAVQHIKELIEIYQDKIAKAVKVLMKNDTPFVRLETALLSQVLVDLSKTNNTENQD